MNSKFAQLRSNITALSENKTWSEAKKEWKLDRVYRSSEAQTCLCGHFPVFEICVLENENSGQKVEVGNVCVNKFLEINSKILFDSIKKIADDKSSAANTALINFALSKKWLSEYESQFLLDTCRKRKLSFAQNKLRVRLNTSLLRKIDLLNEVKIHSIASATTAPLLPRLWTPITSDFKQLEDLSRKNDEKT